MGIHPHQKISDCVCEITTLVHIRIRIRIYRDLPELRDWPQCPEEVHKTYR